MNINEAIEFLQEAKKEIGGEAQFKIIEFMEWGDECDAILEINKEKTAVCVNIAEGV